MLFCNNNQLHSVKSEMRHYIADRIRNKLSSHSCQSWCSAVALGGGYEWLTRTLGVAKEMLLIMALLLVMMMMKPHDTTVVRRR